MTTDYFRIIRDGLWDNNITLTQVLALCPTMAVTSTATNGLGMGLATTAVLICSNGLVASLRHWISPQVRIPVFVVIIATLVTLVDMALNAWFHALYQVLGLFIALIVVNCAILGRAEAFAFRNRVPEALLDGLMMGLGFTLALMVMGGIRELVGSGTLFAGASRLLGAGFTFLEMRLLPGYSGFLLAILPPGGFMTLGLLLAGKRMIDERLARRHKLITQPSPNPL